MNEALRFSTGVITNADYPGRVTAEIRISPSEREVIFLTCMTAFLGAVENKVALASLKPGMSVNLWTEGCYAREASINYK